MIELIDIVMDNFEECLKLKLTKEQEKFVATNMYSLAEAKADGVSQPYAIYAKNKMVGFIMYDYDKGKRRGFITRLMVDYRFQGKNYGREATIKIIDEIKDIPECKDISISYWPDNNIARTLYKSLGFSETGELSGGEEVAILKIDKN